MKSLTLSEIETRLENALKSYILGRGIPTDILTLWVNFFNRVRDSSLSDDEKIRKYLILIDAIKAFDTARYYNSPFVILKDSLSQTLHDIIEFTEKTGSKIKKVFEFATHPAIIISILALIGIMFLNQKGIK